MKDIIIGCFNNYTPDKLNPWVESIKKSGFTGDLLAIIYGNGKNELESEKYLLDNGFITTIIPSFKKSIVVDRFNDMSSYINLNKEKYRFVISTDVGDIIFQTNPSEFLSKKLINKDILVGSECIKFKDETWGRQNMYMSYPNYYSDMMNKTIYNAGSVAAKASTAVEFFKDIYELSLSTYVYNPDQAAMNIFIQSKYHDSTYFSSMKDGWSLQCGTVADPKRLNEYGDLLIENKFEVLNGEVYNENNEKFCLIHQYNRVPWLMNVLIK